MRRPRSKPGTANGRNGDHVGADAGIGTLGVKRPGSVPQVFRRRPNALILSGLAIVAAIAAVIVVAAVSGVSLDRVFEHFRLRWIVVVAIAETVSFVPYMLAYRQMTVVAGLPPPSLLVTIT